MGYHMRFIVKNNNRLSFKELEKFLKEKDSKYEIDSEENEGVLIYNNDEYAELEINKKGDDLFEDEIRELLEEIEDVKGENKDIVLEVLKKSKSFFFVRVLSGGRSSEKTLSKIDPIWTYLFMNYEGLLQADLEGYYDSEELIFEIK